MTNPLSQPIVQRHPHDVRQAKKVMSKLWSLLFLLSLWVTKLCSAEETLAKDNEQSMLLYLWVVSAPVFFFLLYCVCGFWWMYALWHMAWKVATFISPVVDEPLRKSKVKAS